MGAELILLQIAGSVPKLLDLLRLVDLQDSSACNESRYEISWCQTNL